MSSYSNRSVATALLYLTIALVCLAFGGVHLLVGTVASVILAIALVVRVSNRELRVTPIAGVLLLLAGLSLLQLIPLPPAILEWVSPQNYIALAKAEALGVPFGWSPISVDPQQTADRAVRFMVLATGALLAANLSRKGTWERFAMLFAGVAMAVLGFGFFLNLADIRDIDGWISSVGFRKPSTFVNTNHGAAFFGFLVLVMHAWGKYVPSREKGIALSAFGAPVALMFALMHHSVGVVIALLVAGTLSVGLRYRSPKVLSAIAVAAMSAGLAIWLDLHKLVGLDFGDTSNREKLTRAGLNAAMEYWRFGSGAGTTDVVIPREIDWTSMSAYSIPTIENEILEFFVAFGIPAGTLIVVAIIAWFTGAVKTSISNNSVRSQWRVVWIAYFLMIGLLHFPFFTLGIGLPMLVGIEECRIKRRPVWPGFSVWFVVAMSAAAVIATRIEFESPHLPTPFTAVASDVVGSDPERAIRLTEHAMTLDPRPRVVLFSAQIFAKAGDLKKSAEAYQRLYQMARPTRASLGALVRDLNSEPDLLLDVLSFQKESDWMFVVRSVERYFGAAQSTELAFRSIDRNLFASAAQKYLANLFLDIGQTELATIWAESSDSQQLTIRLLLKQKRYQEVVERLKQNIEAAPHEDVLRASSQLLKEGGTGVVEKSRARHCEVPILETRLKTCWLTEGRLNEHRQKWDQARIVYDRIRRRLNDPIPLGHFLRNRGQCKTLLQLSVDEGRPAMKTRLKKLHAACEH